MDENMEFIQDFVDEERGHLENVEDYLIKISKSGTDEELINNIFRAVHSVKGSAGFCGLDKITNLTHMMESLFGQIRAGLRPCTDTIIDASLAANDVLKTMIEDVMNCDKYDAHNETELIQNLLNEDLSAQSALKAPAPETEDVPGSPGSAPAEPTPQAPDFFGNQADPGFSQHASFNDNSGNNAPPAGDQGSAGYDFFASQQNNVSGGGGGLADDFFGSPSSSPPGQEEDKSQSEKLDSDTSSFGKQGFALFSTPETTESTDPPETTQAPTPPVGQQGDSQFDGFSGTSSQPLTANSFGGLNQPLNPQDSSAQPSGPAIEDAAQDNESEKDSSDQKQTKTFVSEDNVRVNVSTLNNLLDMASEMVLGRNQLLSTLESHKKEIKGLPVILQNIDMLTSGLQEMIMQTRMQPIANVFNKIPRIIREISRNMGKDIELELHGTDTELDKNVIETLADPLTHLVRNAADHGIETPEVRLAKGKSRHGTLRLNAYHEGGYVIIDIADDGAGIDSEKVKEKALSQGIIEKKEAELLTEQQIYNLIFSPGFSTAQKVTAISGRGVGMDVVKTNIEKIGGTIEIFSNIGCGTTIRLVIPLTLAIIQSLIIEVEGQRFAIPRVSVQEIVRIKSGDASMQLEYVQQAEVLRHRDTLLPIVHLADVLGIQRTYLDPETGERKLERRKKFVDIRRFKSVVEGELPERRHRKSFDVLRILVLKNGNDYFGVAADSILGTEETLVKPLPIYLKDCACFSGVTIMGDGKAAMILDADGIFKNSNLAFEEDKKLAAQKEEGGTDEAQDLLLFRCSGQEVFAMDISVVSRVLKINVSEIQRVGDREYIIYNDAALRVIRPEDYIAVSRLDKPRDEFFLVIPKLMSNPIGILIEEVYDSVNMSLDTAGDDMDLECITGSVIIDKKITLLLNIYELLEKADPKNYGVDAASESSGKKILLVEDSPFFLKTVQEYCEGAGFQVVTAMNGKEGLEVLASSAGDIDLVISDINMPVMDGIELVKQIKKYSSLPVIALTTETAESQVKAGLEAGFDHYINKLDREKLIKVMLSIL